jgi:hypothetical protein
MNPDPEFERQLLFCHERLMVAYGHFDEPIDPDAAIGALVWLLCDTIHMLPHHRQPHEIKRVVETLTDIFSGDSDESEPAEPPASLALI